MEINLREGKHMRIYPKVQVARTLVHVGLCKDLNAAHSAVFSLTNSGVIKGFEGRPTQGKRQSFTEDEAAIALIIIDLKRSLFGPFNAVGLAADIRGYIAAPRVTRHAAVLGSTDTYYGRALGIGSSLEVNITKYYKALQVSANAGLIKKAA